MPAFKLTINPTFRDLAGRFATANKNLLEDRRSILQAEGRRFQSIARAEAPKKTGDFARGIKWRSFIRANAVGFTISTPKPLGDWIARGTPPHVIVPRGPGYPLRFVIGGRTIYTYRVNHPGTKPNPFMQRAKDKWMPGAMTNIRRIATRWKTNVSG